MPLPVTAKLARAFYEKPGDALTNELVEGFNQVDATYRSDLRELNELNVARFDAKVEQRFAEQDAKWERRFAELETRLLRWMFLFWIGQSATTADLVLGIVRLTAK
jgi:hypothetical protein